MDTIRILRIRRISFQNGRRKGGPHNNTEKCTRTQCFLGIPPPPQKQIELKSAVEVASGSVGIQDESELMKI